MPQAAYLYDFLTYSGRHKLDGFYQGCRELKLDVSDERICQIERTLEAAEASVGRLVRIAVRIRRPF